MAAHTKNRCYKHTKFMQCISPKVEPSELDHGYKFILTVLLKTWEASLSLSGSVDASAGQGQALTFDLLFRASGVTGGSRYAHIVPVDVLEKHLSVPPGQSAGLQHGDDTYQHRLRQHRGTQLSLLTTLSLPLQNTSHPTSSGLEDHLKNKDI